jgi:hypothetical protein
VDVPSQGRDGKTVVVHNDAFEGGASHREVLYLYGPSGKLVTANVMPRYAGTASAVYPLGLDVDWNSNAVASASVTSTEALLAAREPSVGDGQPSGPPRPRRIA